MGFFKSSRGVLQGDPIAPSLFIIAEEVLSRSLTRAFQSGLVDWYASPRNCPNISHLLFADDTLIFCKGNIISIRNLLKILNAYERALGQLINEGKSGFFIHSIHNNSVARKIEEATGFVRHSFPHRYLGFPLVKGRCKKVHYTGILNTVQKRISGWKSRMLSQGAKLVFIKHVLSSLPIYFLTSSSLHIGTHQALEQSFANFFWGSSAQGNKKHWRSWKFICKPILQGGLGIMSLRHMEIALRVKMLWQALHSNSLWADYFRAKYIRNCPLVKVQFKNMKGFERRSWITARNLIIQHKRVIIGDGSRTNFLYDRWLGNYTLPDFVPADHITNPEL